MSSGTGSAEVVRRLFDEGLNRGDPAVAASFYAEDASNHGRRVGRAGMRAVFEALLAVFPDLRFEVVETIAETERVACTVVLTGTHLGQPTLADLFQGSLAGVPPTGRPVRVLQIHLFRLQDGRISEHEAVRDDLGMLRQLGLC